MQPPIAGPGYPRFLKTQNLHSGDSKEGAADGMPYAEKNGEPEELSVEVVTPTADSEMSVDARAGSNEVRNSAQSSLSGLPLGGNSTEQKGINDIARWGTSFLGQKPETQRLFTPKSTYSTASSTSTSDAETSTFLKRSRAQSVPESSIRKNLSGILEDPKKDSRSSSTLSDQSESLEPSQSEDKNNLDDHVLETPFSQAGVEDNDNPSISTTPEFQQQQRSLGDLHKKEVLEASNKKSESSSESDSDSLIALDKITNGRDVSPTEKLHNESWLYGCKLTNSNFLKVLARQTLVSVGTTTFGRELMRAYMPAGYEMAFMAATGVCLAYPGTLNNAGLWYSYNAYKEINTALNKFGAHLSTLGLADDQITRIKAALSKTINKNGKIAERKAKNIIEFNKSVAIDYKTLFADESFINLKSTLEAQNPYRGTIATTVARVLNIAGLAGLGAASFKMGLWPELGRTLPAFVLYCTGRGGTQLFVGADAKILKWHLYPTLVSAVLYGGNQILVNIGMDAMRGIPEYALTGNAHANTAIVCLGLGAINALGETLDLMSLLHTHAIFGQRNYKPPKSEESEEEELSSQTLISATQSEETRTEKLVQEPIDIHLSLGYPTRAQLTETWLGIETARVSLFPILVLTLSIIGKLYPDLSPMEMAIIGGLILLVGYPFLVTMGIGPHLRMPPLTSR